ncbi:MAG: sensor histidine kinase, partial [Erysipelotrichaceae bacterium]
IFVNQVDMVSATIANLSKLLETQQEVMPLEWTTFEMETVLVQLVNGLQMSFEKQGLQLQLHATPCTLESDAYRVAQILYNLLTNALKFSQPGQSVHVRGEVVEDHYQIQVIDQGIGMSETTLRRLFEPYFQAHPTQYPGEGIGLYVVKQYVNQLHGSIQVHSSEQKGTTFILDLPLRKPR